MKLNPGAFSIAAFATAGLLIAGSGAQAQQAYPSKPVRLIVGFTAGGASDIMGRAIAARLSEQLGQSVVVENRPGAASNIGADHVAKSAPDGYTILLGTISLSINPSLYKSLTYNARTDLLPISQIATTPFMLVVHPSSPIRSVGELIAAAKAAKEPLQYATAGSGSGSHLFMEYFSSLAGIKMQAIPYKGTAPAMTDVIGGRVPLTFDNVITTGPLSSSGKLRGLAVSTTTRASIAPEIPTMVEAGVAGFDAQAWFGLFAPAGTPAPIVNRLEAETIKALRDPKVQEAFRTNGAEPMGTTAAQFGQFFINEIDKWAKVVTSAQVKPE
jgi:tripartite-type tricarboxylate transporter receptor subunit TctC